MTETQSASRVRPPAVAGAFYPAHPAALIQQIDGYLAKAERLEPEPSIIIVPHAGYVFSGGVAAHGFKQALDRGYQHVIILGFNHGYAYSFDGAAVWPDGAWSTPLGEVPIDEPLAQAILKAAPVFTPDRSIHLGEHSLEVEVPFIQRVLSGVPIVPISIGKPTLENAQAIAAGLARVLNETPHTLVVTSTDLSHYPRYQDAQRVDHSSLQAVVSLIRWRWKLGRRSHVELHRQSAHDDVRQGTGDGLDAVGAQHRRSSKFMSFTMLIQAMCRKGSTVA